MTFEERFNFYIQITRSLAMGQGFDKAMADRTGAYLRPTSEAAQMAMRAAAAQAAAQIEEDDDLPHQTLGQAAGAAPWYDWWKTEATNQPPLLRVAGDQFLTFENVAENFLDPEDLYHDDHELKNAS